MGKFYNSGVPQFLPKVKTYCAKVLPMVFDNSISYYETVCHLIHKVNECIEALNAQNLNIIEFTHMVSVEIEKFEKFIDNYINELESTFRKEWEKFKTELNTDWEEYKNFLTSEWENEKKENESFRNELQREWLSFKDELNLLHDNFIIEIRNKIQEHVDDINSKLEEYENTYNTDFNNLRENLQHQNDEFEDHMVELFNTFKETEKASRTEFESNFQQLFEQWKTNTLNAITEQINHEHTEMYDSLKNWIEVQINLAKDAMKNNLNNTERKLTQEIESRISGDNNLQTQINQLTPEGSIKYEQIENSELHQLYGIKNGQRVDIYPETLQKCIVLNLMFNGSQQDIIGYASGLHLHLTWNRNIKINGSSKKRFYFSYENLILIPKEQLESLRIGEVSPQIIRDKLMIVYTVVDEFPNSYTLQISESNVSYVTDNNQIAYLGITLSLTITLDDLETSSELFANKIAFKVIAIKFN